MVHILRLMSYIPGFGFRGLSLRMKNTLQAGSKEREGRDKIACHDKPFHIAANAKPKTTNPDLQNLNANPKLSTFNHDLPLSKSPSPM